MINFNQPFTLHVLSVKEILKKKSHNRSTGKLSRQQTNNPHKKWSGKTTEKSKTIQGCWTRHHQANYPEKLSSEIAPILTIIFNFSMEKEKLPDDWRTADVTPAYKKGQKYIAANYKPISQTYICCKIIEHTVTSNIYKHAYKILVRNRIRHGSIEPVPAKQHR